MPYIFLPFVAGALTKRTLITGLMFVFAIFLADTCPASEISPNRTFRGKHTEVRLLDVIRPHPGQIGTVVKGAEDGLVFLFYATKLSSGEGMFSLSEPRDFHIGNDPYRKKSLGSLQGQLEPLTEINDVSRFIKNHPKCASLVEERQEKSVVLIVTIGGAVLINGATGKIVIDVGWNQSTEKFSFIFEVPHAINRP